MDSAFVLCTYRPTNWQKPHWWVTHLETANRAFFPESGQLFSIWVLAFTLPRTEFPLDEWYSQAYRL